MLVLKTESEFAMRSISKIRTSLSGALLLAGTSAFAAVPEAVTTEITGAKTDVMAVGALVFAVAVGIVVFKWFKRAL